MINLVRRFLGDRNGNFAIALSILSIPMVASVGLAVDYSSMSRQRTGLQNATDAAVLAVAREGANLSDAQANQIARNFMVATMPDAKGLTLSLVRQGKDIKLSTSMQAETYFDNFLGMKRQTVNAESTSTIATMSYEIGLVIDTTGSMRGGKLRAMKDAVSGLIDSMSEQVQERNRLRFALVPFSSFVNVGPQQGPTFNSEGRQNPSTGKSWLDLSGLSLLVQSEFGPGASRFQLYKNMKQDWPGCVEARTSASGLDVNDVAPVGGNAATLFVPALAPDEPDSGYLNSYLKSSALPYDQSVSEKKKRWTKYGVETDSQGNPLNGGLLSGVVSLLNGILGLLLDTSTTSNGDPKGPGMGCNARPIIPLTTDTADIKRKVELLEAKGNTNITEGVAWGTRVLSPGEPFTEGAAYNRADVRKIMIVLTDGANTMGARPNVYGSNYSAYGYLNDGRLPGAGASEPSIKDAMNDRSLAACTVAKDAGIEVFTIRLEEPDVATGTMLRECASNPNNYFDVPNRSQLDDAFKNIKDRVTVVRLSS